MNKNTVIELEKWEQVGEVGRGGFGVVYIGKLRSGVIAAVKHLNLERYNLESSTFQKYKTHISKEIKILSKLNDHPNIVK